MIDRLRLKVSYGDSRQGEHCVPTEAKAGVLHLNKASQELRLSAPAKWGCTARTAPSADTGVRVVGGGVGIQFWTGMCICPPLPFALVRLLQSFLTT